MIAFYDFEVFKHDWLVVFKTASRVYKIHNDRDKLKKILKNFSLLIGFNNHNYDDYILAELLRDKVVTEVYDLSQSIVIDKIKPKIRLNFPTIDVMQEMKQGVGLKEIEANLKLNIHETPVNFNLKRKLFDHEIEKTFRYCENDVKVTETIFNLRSDYFQSKFEIIQEFGLDNMCIKNTRAILASKVLKCKKINLPNDRLNLTYDKRLDLDKIPEIIRNFYIDIEKKFNAGGNFEELEKEQLEYNLNGVPHFFGFGGLHGAVDNLIYEGNMLCIDVGSYYPSLMINNNFISRASESPELYKNLYKKRMEYKAKKDGRQQVYKILLNATFGAMKSGFNKLFDPVQSNNICVNGQLILTDLIIRISSLCKIIQSNTDGLIVAYDEKDLENALINKITSFLLELGKGFSYMGRQVHLKVGKSDFYIDLLFYHVKLHCYIVIELKTEKLKPEFVGQLNFYITAVDKDIKSKNDNQTIGILICKDKDNVVAEYSLANISQPIGISKYEINKFLNNEYKNDLPSIKEIEEGIKFIL